MTPLTVILEGPPLLTPRDLHGTLVNQATSDEIADDIDVYRRRPSTTMREKMVPRDEAASLYQTIASTDVSRLDPEDIVFSEVLVPVGSQLTPRPASPEAAPDEGERVLREAAGEVRSPRKEFQLSTAHTALPSASPGPTFDFWGFGCGAVRQGCGRTAELADVDQ